MVDTKEVKFYYDCLEVINLKQCPHPVDSFFLSHFLWICFMCHESFHHKTSVWLVKAEVKQKYYIYFTMKETLFYPK